MYGPVVHTILKKKNIEGESPLIRVAFAHRSVLCQNNVKEQWLEEEDRWHFSDRVLKSTDSTKEEP